MAMAELLAVEGSMIDSTILVRVRSRLAGRKFLMPPMRDSKLDERLVGTPVSLRRSARRVEMDEKRPKRSVEADACGADELIVVSWVILVVARTLRERVRR